MKEIYCKSMKFIWLTWKDIEEDLLKLSKEIREKKVEPTVLIGILRWGTVVAALLSDKLSMKKVYAIGCTLYTGIKNKGKEVEIYQKPEEKLIRGQVVMLVDDVSDTGTTLKRAREVIEKAKPKRVYTSTLHVKPWSKYKPDFHAKEYDGWICYPWSRNELKRELMNKYWREEDKNKLLRKIKGFFMTLTKNKGKFKTNPYVSFRIGWKVPDLYLVL